MNPAELETHLSYRFTSADLLKQALNHRTWVHENPEMALEDNQRLEFLGDAVLGLTIGHLLMERFPLLKEGDLTRMRANLVNESQLANMARQMNLGAYIRLGRGEIQTGGRKKSSILADTFEAMIAAVYLDGGYQAALDSVRELFAPLLHGTDRDFKSQLQEQAQKARHPIPAYSVVCENGPDHDKSFQVRVAACGIQAIGVGKNKKSAEQAAAEKALERLASKV